MENFKVLTQCDEGPCCCFTPRSTSVLIAVIGLLACLLDVLSNDTIDAVCGEAKEYLTALRNLLLTLFQMANILLLLGSIVENALLLQIYLWYMLALIVLAFVVAIVEFCFQARDEGAWSLVTFVPEVMLLFVMFRCLPLVDTYRKHLEATNY